MIGERTNGKFFRVGSLSRYSIACALVWTGSTAWGQFDLDSLVEKFKPVLEESNGSRQPDPDPEPVSNGFTAYDEDDYDDMDSPAAQAVGTDDLDGSVEVSSYSTVDIHVQNTDLARVLQMLSIQSSRNIIISKNVSGTVSADLYDVTFFEALDAILNSNGYGYIEEGPFIKVMTLQEIQEEQDKQRVRTSRIFQLSYLNAADASVFMTPLLSDQGTIAISGEVAAGFDPDESDGGGESWASFATLMVHDYEENLEDIAELIDQLDVRPQQVLVEATVLQTTLNEDNAWGMDWSIVADVNFTDFTNPLSAVNDLIAGSGDGGYQPPDNNAFATGSNVGQTAKSGGLKIGVVSDDISVFLRVLDEVTDTTVMSRPRVLAVNRNRGEILIGRRIGYLSSTSTETSTTQTVQFLDTGTQLIFRPFVGKDGFIRMELKPSISEGIIRDVTGSDGNTFTIPDEVTQELTTNVVVRDGHTIVLGGLFKEETTLTRRQVPVLGDIPVIGAAFKGREDSTRRSEITFLITPTVMKDEVLIAQGDAAVDMVNRARIGGRMNVLWWSNDRQTSHHNMQARELMDAGDYELALWHIDLSLNLKPNQPLVLRMREEILGKPQTWFNGSIMDSIGENSVSSRLDQYFGPSIELTEPETVSVPLIDPLLDATTQPVMDEEFVDVDTSPNVLEASDPVGEEVPVMDGVIHDDSNWESQWEEELESQPLSSVDEQTSFDSQAQMPVGSMEVSDSTVWGQWGEWTTIDFSSVNGNEPSTDPELFLNGVIFNRGETAQASTLESGSGNVFSGASYDWATRFQSDLMQTIIMAQSMNPAGQIDLSSFSQRYSQYQAATDDERTFVEVMTDGGIDQK